KDIVNIVEYGAKNTDITLSDDKDIVNIVEYGAKNTDMEKLATSFCVKISGKKNLGKSLSSTALDNVAHHIFFNGDIIILTVSIVYGVSVSYSSNVLYLMMTAFEELVKELYWEFIRKKRNQIAFLYGDDDHSGPLCMHDEEERIPEKVIAKNCTFFFAVVPLLAPIIL
nr:lipid droplet-associated hydrolase isoform X1 [Tanacetum cinerariifolium]